MIPSVFYVKSETLDRILAALVEDLTALQQEGIRVPRHDAHAIWVFPKVGVPFRVPKIRNMVFFGSILNPPMSILPYDNDLVVFDLM